MKIKCSYCNTLVDTEVQTHCSHCGASVADNNEYQKHVKEKAERDAKMKDLLYEEQQLNIERKEIENEKARRQLNKPKTQPTQKKKTNPVVVSIIIFMSIFWIAVIFGGIRDLSNSGALDALQPTEPYVEPHHDAKIGEVVSTKNYQLVLDQWGYFEPSNGTSDGWKYIKFHFTYTNTTDSKIYNEEKVTCYDSNGKECSKLSTSYLSDDDVSKILQKQWVMPSRSYSGWSYFAIPESATECAIAYGENIEIKVDLDENGEFFDKDTAIVYYVGEFGETIVTKKHEVVVDDFGYYQPEMTFGSGLKYIKLHVVYKNISKSNTEVSARAYCYDENGAEYTSKSMWVSGNDEAERIQNQKILPGKSYSGWYYFDIPQDVEEITIMLFKNLEIHVNLKEVEQ